MQHPAYSKAVKAGGVSVTYLAARVSVHSVHE
jgi:hypothetical protein